MQQGMANGLAGGMHVGAMGGNQMQAGLPQAPQAGGLVPNQLNPPRMGDLSVLGGHFDGGLSQMGTSLAMGQLTTSSILDGGGAAKGGMLPVSGQLEGAGVPMMGGTALPSESALQTMGGEQQMWPQQQGPQFRMVDNVQGFRMQPEVGGMGLGMNPAPGQGLTQLPGKLLLDGGSVPQQQLILDTQMAGSQQVIQPQQTAPAGAMMGQGFVLHPAVQQQQQAMNANNQLGGMSNQKVGGASAGVSQQGGGGAPKYVILQPQQAASLVSQQQGVDYPSPLKTQANQPSFGRRKPQPGNVTNEQHNPLFFRTLTASEVKNGYLHLTNRDANKLKRYQKKDKLQMGRLWAAAPRCETFLTLQVEHLDDGKRSHGLSHRLGRLWLFFQNNGIKEGWEVGVGENDNNSSQIKLTFSPTPLGSRPNHLAAEDDHMPSRGQKRNADGTTKSRDGGTGKASAVANAVGHVASGAEALAVTIRSQDLGVIDASGLSKMLAGLDGAIQSLSGAVDSLKGVRDIVHEAVKAQEAGATGDQAVEEPAEIPADEKKDEKENKDKGNVVELEQDEGQANGAM